MLVLYFFAIPIEEIFRFVKAAVRRYHILGSSTRNIGCLMDLEAFEPETKLLAGLSPSEMGDGSGSHLSDLLVICWQSVVFFSL